MSAFKADVWHVNKSVAVAVLALLVSILVTVAGVALGGARWVGTLETRMGHVEQEQSVCRDTSVKLTDALMNIDRAVTTIQNDIQWLRRQKEGRN